MGKQTPSTGAYETQELLEVAFGNRRNYVKEESKSSPTFRALDANLSNDIETYWKNDGTQPEYDLWGYEYNNHNVGLLEHVDETYKNESKLNEYKNAAKEVDTPEKYFKKALEVYEKHFEKHVGGD